jgi:hypothetical protein
MDWEPGICDAERIVVCCGTEGYAGLVPYIDCEAGVCGADGVPVVAGRCDRGGIGWPG